MNDSRPITIPPDDVINQELVRQVHPADWTNPRPSGRYNMVVIGGGTAGLVTAAGAAGLGARVALIERHLLGGDCLNYGCVPSKTLIRAARAIHDVRTAANFGIHIGNTPSVDFESVMERVRRVRADISHHDSAKRFQSLGVDVFLGDAAFTGPDTIEVGGQTLRFSKACIATGARAFVPPVAGLQGAGFLTNENVFNLTDQPARLVVVGGGPIGCELAQAFQRLGTQVTLIETAPQILIREDADAARIVSESLARDGVQFAFNTKVTRVENNGETKRVIAEEDGKERVFECDDILLSVGRAPNVDGLELDSAGVKFDKKSGIEVDDNLRTSNPRVFAAGDCCMQLKFTHAADAAARIVIQNALFGFLPKKAKVSALTVPWCTYTDPEIAHVGLSERDAKDKGIPIDTFRIPLADVDRAKAEGDTNGVLKVHTEKRSDKIVGATMVARHAGDMINEITAAMVTGTGLGALSNVIHPYPTEAEAIKKAADAYKRTRLTPAVARIMRTLMRWQR